MRPKYWKTLDYRLILLWLQGASRIDQQAARAQMRKRVAVAHIIARGVVARRAAN